MIKISHYDPESDSLIVSSIEDNEKPKYNYTIGEMIVTLTNSGKIVSVEIPDFSKHLKDIGKNIDDLGDLDNLDLIINPQRGFIYIGVGLEGNVIPLVQLPSQIIKN